MKLNKPTPKLNKTLTGKLFEKDVAGKESEGITFEEKELPNIHAEKKIEINSILGKSYSDF